MLALKESAMKNKDKVNSEIRQSETRIDQLHVCSKDCLSSWKEKIKKTKNKYTR